MRDSSAYNPGNGNGNKLNRRVEIFENLLRASGCDTTAKTNSLRQTLRRNKQDMADNTTKSLDVLRQVFQSDITEEIKQVIDRHILNTFAPAFENLRRNGHDVAESDINELCISILDGSKSAFMLKFDQLEDEGEKSIPAYTALLKYNMPEVHSHSDEVLDTYESDANESDTSLHSYSSSIQNSTQNSANATVDKPRKRGRPKKNETDSGSVMPPIGDRQSNFNTSDICKWNPERFNRESHFILASKANKLLGFGPNRGRLPNKYSRMFRYIADEEERNWMFQKNLIKRTGGRVLLISLDDVLELAKQEDLRPQLLTELQRYSFVVPERILQKIKLKMTATSEHLRSRFAVNHSPQQFIPAFPI